MKPLQKRLTIFLALWWSIYGVQDEEQLTTLSYASHLFTI